VPPQWNQPQTPQRHHAVPTGHRSAPTPHRGAPPRAASIQRTHPTREARHQSGAVQQARSSRQAVRTQVSRTVHRANVATPVPPSRPSDLNGRKTSELVAEARRYLGTNPTGRARLWCARFVNFVLDRVGQPGTGSDAAKSFALYGRRISGPQYGAIAVLTRKGGGHVGIVTGVDRNGNPILIAGNNGRRQVGISVYPKRRVIAYVMPDGRAPSKPKTIRYATSKKSRYASAKSTRTR
jgi:uncharacterized protein (TIGR02594 family)